MVRKLVAVMWTLPVLAFLVLGMLWTRDRARTWEAPRWDATRFTPIVADSLAAGPPLRLVAVQPRCPHCVTGLQRLTERERLRPAPAAGRIVALVVDTPRRPAPALAAGLGVAELWWDRAGIWRGRWGRRVYGEVLIFDREGRYLRSTHVATTEGDLEHAAVAAAPRSHRPR